MPRSSKTGKGGTGPLKREDGKTYCLDTGNTNAVEITYPITLSLDMGRYEKYRAEIENSVNQDKATAIDASYYKGFGVRSGACRQVVQEKQFIQLSTDGQSDFVIKSGTLRTHKDGEGFREVVSGKGATVPARGREDGSGQNVVSMGSRIRRLTPIECARLQTIYDDYLMDSDGKFHVSESQLYRMIGNGWTIDVIAYLLSYLK
jgi:site-specific DNA-cytosine methylase